MKRADRLLKILAGWLIVSQILWVPSAHALRSESAQENAVLERLKAGMEELSDEEELDLIERIRNDWQFKLKVGSRVDTQALEMAVGGLPEEMSLFHRMVELLRKFNRDVYLMEDKDLKGQGALLGATALWMGEEAMLRTDISRLIQAFETGDFSMISGALQPAVEPALPASNPTAPSAAAVSPAPLPPKPAPPVPKREPSPASKPAPPAKVLLPPPAPVEELSFPEVLSAILDPAGQESRSAREWSRLVARLAKIWRQDEKPALSKTRDQIARLAGWKTFRKVSVIPFSLDELIRKVEGEIGTGQVSGAAVKFRDRLDNPRQVARWMATAAAPAWESYREDLEMGAIPPVLPLDGTLEPADYLIRFRLRMMSDCRRQDYENAAAYRVGFLHSVDKEDLGEPSPFGILSVLAARQFGQGAAFRSFPELANALLENGVEDIRLLPSEPGAPPSLRIQFIRPIEDPSGRTKSKALAAVLLREPWPALPPEPEKPWAEMSDGEMVETAARSMAREMEAVEFDEAAVQPFAFSPEDSPADQARKVIALARLAAEGRLAARSRHLLYPENPRVERIVRWLTRAPAHREALRRYLQLGLDVERRRGQQSGRPAAASPAEREKFRAGAAARENAVAVLSGLNLPGLAQDLEALRRAESAAHRLGAGKERLFSVQEWDSFRPLLALLFARDERGGWAVSEQDQTTLLNRLNQFRSVLLSDSLGSHLRRRADLFGENRAAFLAEINHAVLRGDLLAKPLRDIPMERAHEVLVGCCELIFGPPAGRSPTALLLRRARQQDLLGKIALVQERMWEDLLALLPAGLEEDPLQRMETALSELEEAAGQMEKLGPWVPEGMEVKPLSLPLKEKDPAALEKTLAFLGDQVTQLLAVQGTSSASARIPLFQALLEIGRLAQEGRFQEALERSGALLPDLQGDGERERLQQIQGGLRRRIDEEKQRQAAAEKERRRKQMEALLAEQARSKRPPAVAGGGERSLQEKAAAILKNSDFQEELSQNGRLKDLLQEIAKTGEGRAKAERYQGIKQWAEGRLKDEKVKESPQRIAFYSAVIAIAKDLLALPASKPAPPAEQAGLEEVKAARERVQEMLAQLREKSADFGQRVVVVGPSIYRDRMPFLPTLVEEALGPVSEQIFFDPWATSQRIDCWVRQFYDRPQGLPTGALYLGEEGEFESFQQFGRTVLLPRLPVRFPEGGIASDPALLILQWLDSIGLSMAEDQRRRLKSDLELIIQA